MQNSLPDQAICQEPGCGFTYDPARPNTLRNHKSGVHVPSTKVTYSDPKEETLLVRKDGLFYCTRCTYSSAHPNVIQKHCKTCIITPVLPMEVATSSPLGSPSLSLSCSPPELPTLDLRDYIPLPGRDTIVHHPSYNLPLMGVVINLKFRCFICLKCSRAIDASKLIEHVRGDLPLIDIPADLPSDLQSEYSLIPYNSIVYIPGPISPIFGLALHPEPVFFCECGKGYATFETLRPHQTRVGERECPYRERKAGFHKGYAQRLTGNRPLFEVDPSPWRHKSDISLHYPLAFCRSLPPLRDYSKMEIKGAEDEMNTSSFFYTQRWLHHIKGFTSEDIQEVVLITTPEAPYGGLLRKVGEEFLKQANAKIKDFSSFGLLRSLGQTTGYVFLFILMNLNNTLFRRDTLNRFDPVSEKTVEKYALTLHRLVFGVLRQLDPSYLHKYRYPPLHPTQLLPLQSLRVALDEGLSIADLVLLYRAACLTLFAHHQHKYETSKRLDQFFSPVICYLVLRSVRENGDFQLPSVISQYIAHIMFSIRSVILYEIINKAHEEDISFSDAYSYYKEYLMSGHETPMAYYYNTDTLLISIRSDEANEARFTCTDERGREFSYEGSIIKVSHVTKMINELTERYKNEVKLHCLFGEELPESLDLKVKIEDIVDNLQNTQSGYTFLDDPRNPFHEYRSSYGEWLLSDSDRATHYAYMHEDILVWKPAPCLVLLREMQNIREILLLACIFSAGPSSRATEVARQLLRNVPGSMRNILILFHFVCLVDIQDKTSHKHLRDKYVPHCPSETVAMMLVYNLVVFRPFEEYLVQNILGDEASLRYHQQLWPGLKGTITDTRVSDSIGRECTRHLVQPSSLGKVSHKILFWRNFVSAVLKHQPDFRVRATHQQFYIDTALMHSSAIGVARYGGLTDNLPMSDPRQVAECIKVGFAWQDILNLGRKRSLIANIDVQLEEMETDDSRKCFSSFP